MKDKSQLDEMRRRIQGAISQAKRDELRDKFGMKMEHSDSNLPPEAEIEWLENIVEFEKQFESGKTITVRERIGNPILKPLDEIPLYALEQAVEDLLDLLAKNGIAVDFMGDFDDIAAYRYIAEELLDEEIDDIGGGWQTVFTPSTPEYDVQMWAESFVLDLFTQEREYFLPGLDKQPLFDTQGEPITAVQFRQQIEQVWKVLTATNRVSIEPITVQAEKEEGTITAVITWQNDKQETIGQIESYFRLFPSPYTGWNVVQTTLLDDLLQFFEA
ncbi:MAG: hypothetical protein GY943_22345 [Chloroflexi bacterium]|nr:hypothetical protein [Chloroflexota bacterium]